MPRLSAQPFHPLRISGTGTGTGTFTGAAGIQGQALESNVLESSGVRLAEDALGSRSLHKCPLSLVCFGAQPFFWHRSARSAPAAAVVRATTSPPMVCAKAEAVAQTAAAAGAARRAAHRVRAE